MLLPTRLSFNRLGVFAQCPPGGVGLIYGFVYINIPGGGTGHNTPKQMIYTLGGPMLLAICFPNTWVNRRVDECKAAITSGVPDSLDLMPVCGKTGPVPDQSIFRVAMESRASYPAPWRFIPGPLAVKFETITYGSPVKCTSVRTHPGFCPGFVRYGIQDVPGLSSL